MQPKVRTTRMDSDAVDGKRMALALGALQERVQRLQKARKDAVAERTALEVRADHLDAALDAARAAREDSKRRAAVRAAKIRRDRAVAATAAVEREIAVLEGRVAAQHEAFGRKPRPTPAPPTETPPPPGTEDYRACLAKALANAKDANETLALARVYARTVTT